MIKKLLLITLFDENNIGNRLQNYALKKKLRDYGTEVTILDNFYTTNPRMDYVIKYYIKRLLTKIGCSKYKTQRIDFFSLKKIRSGNVKFDKQNLGKIVRIKNKDAFNHNWSDYDLAIVGSDQVWHGWRNDPYELPFYYLQFMPQNKRVAYAASFGFEDFPKDDVEMHIKCLLEMNKISCRESSGCELIKKYTGKDAARVLDPTLLLSASEWRKIGEQAYKIPFIDENRKYIFIYFLGNITQEYDNYIKEVIKDNNIDLVVDFCNDANMKYIQKGPSEFIKLIENAEYVFTDSFHCTVFSLLFNKKFTVFRRQQSGFEKMFGRIEDLLASKGALEHVYGGTDVKPTNDFDKLYNESIEYLESILKI